MRAKPFLLLCLALLLGALLVPGETFAQKKARSGAVRKGKKAKKAKKAKPAPSTDTDTDSDSDSNEEGDELDEADEDVPMMASGAKGDSGDGGMLQRSGRMEFDERLIKGQAAQSGAVYLFKRVPRQLPGLVPLRRSYRKRIVEPVLGLRPLKPVVYSALEDGSTAPVAPAPSAQAADAPPSTEAALPKSAAPPAEKE